MNKTLLFGALMLSVVIRPAFAAGDPLAGETVFKKCAACHAVGEGAKNKVGPELNELMGRVAGTALDYNYSQAMIDAGAAGLIWTPESLVPWLHKPKEAVAGTKMTFAGLGEQADIDNVIAYLLTFSPDYVPSAPSAN
ncbi:MAG: cytochrome c family protein [Devosia sp.]